VVLQSGQMPAQSACEGWNRGEESLLQAGEQKTRARQRSTLEAGLAPIAVGLQERDQLRSIGRKAVDDGPLDDAPGKSSNAKLSQVALESPHHDWLKIARLYREAARESLGVQYFEERGEAV
jgi:hypothetical protein